MLPVDGGTLFLGTFPKMEILFIFCFIYLIDWYLFFCFHFHALILMIPISQALVSVLWFTYNYIKTVSGPSEVLFFLIILCYVCVGLKGWNSTGILQFLLVYTGSILGLFWGFHKLIRNTVGNVSAAVDTHAPPQSHCCNKSFHSFESFYWPDSVCVFCTFLLCALVF